MLSVQQLEVRYEGIAAVRGISMFGESFVTVVFEDGTDLYWARSRVLEYLNFARDRLPKGADPKLGPDATGVGWVYQYVLLPGYYSPDHPAGLWRDPVTSAWYAKPADAPATPAAVWRAAQKRVTRQAAE